MPKLTNLVIDEVSLCAKGMNQHARVALFKKAPDEGDPGGGSANKDDVEKNAENLAADFSADNVNASREDSGAGENSMPQTDLEKAQAEIDALKTASAEATAKLAKAEKLAKMSDAAKAYMATLAKADVPAFMEKPEDEQDKECKKAADIAKASDETLTVGDATVRKSEIGSAAFAVLKSQSEAIAKQAEQIAKAEEKAELATLEKRAIEEFAHLPGTSVEKAKVLKAIAAMPEEVRKSQENILKAAEATAKLAFETRGTRNVGKSDGSVNFAKRVDEIAARDGVSKTVAMAKARTEYPDDFAAYQDEAN